jgi:cbb3-type cytochrome oxidase maturation protein
VAPYALLGGPVMTALAWLIPAALALGALGLAAFLWTLRTGQYEDLDGAGWRALEDELPAVTQRVPPAKMGAEP